MYKKILIPFVFLFSLLLIISSCNEKDEPETPITITPGESVEINGVVWATRNVDMPGTFAEKPESSGMFYQWGRNIAWSTDADAVVSDWDSNFYTGDTWTRANDPCPQGWRVPTRDEIQTLRDADNVTVSELTTVNGVHGRTFTDRATNNTIFLPVVGFRNHTDGALWSGSGDYWSSTLSPFSDTTALCLGFNSSVVLVSVNNRASGLSIRCVAE